jgi:hypothetical protein
MNKLLCAAATLAVLVMAVPASAQVYLGPDPGWDNYYGDGADCRVVRERTVTPSGRVIIRTYHDCD